MVVICWTPPPSGSQFSPGGSGAASSFSGRQEAQGPLHRQQVWSDHRQAPQACCITHLMLLLKRLFLLQLFFPLLLPALALQQPWCTADLPPWILLLLDFYSFSYSKHKTCILPTCIICCCLNDTYNQILLKVRFWSLLWNISTVGHADGAQITKWGFFLALHGVVKKYQRVK